MATSPNEVWSWDIWKLKGPARSIYYDFYVVIGIFSRPDLNGLDQVRNQGEDTPTQPVLGELVDPPFDQVQPGRRGGVECRCQRALGVFEPCGDRWCLVRRKIVQHDVDVEVLWDVDVDELEEGRTSVTLWDFFVSKSTSPVPTFMAVNRSAVSAVPWRL
jgi:hypothetical protein